MAQRPKPPLHRHRMRPRGSLIQSSAAAALGELAVGDHVLCKGGHVAAVVGQRRDASGERFVLCRWYFRPEDAPSGRQPHDGCSELLASDGIDIVPLSFVLCRCRVLAAAEFTRERDAQLARIQSAREGEHSARDLDLGATQGGRVLVEKLREAMSLPADASPEVVIDECETRGHCVPDTGTQNMRMRLEESCASLGLPFVVLDDVELHQDIIHKLASNSWYTALGDFPEKDPSALCLLSVMGRLLRRVQAEVRPDECRRPLQNWLGPATGSVDKEEHPAPTGSAAESSRLNTLCPRVGTGGSISMLREVFYKPGTSGMTGDVLCPRLLNPEGSFALVLDEEALRNDKGFNYSMGLVCPRTAQDSEVVRDARAELKNLYCCRRRLSAAPAPTAAARPSSEPEAPLDWIEPVRLCAVTRQPENIDFPLRICPLRKVAVDPRYMHGARVCRTRKKSAAAASGGRGPRGVSGTVKTGGVSGGRAKEEVPKRSHKKGQGRGGRQGGPTDRRRGAGPAAAPRQQVQPWMGTGDAIQHPAGAGQSSAWAGGAPRQGRVRGDPGRAPPARLPGSGGQGPTGPNVMPAQPDDSESSSENTDDLSSDSDSSDSDSSSSEVHTTAPPAAT